MVVSLSKEDEYQPVSDLFDYYYEHDESLTEKKYQIGDLDEVQKNRLQIILNEYKDIYARSLNDLGR
ncbi:6069_t:CDS:1, partial [Gigaspora rosea]